MTATSINMNVDISEALQVQINMLSAQTVTLSAQLTALNRHFDPQFEAIVDPELTFFGAPEFATSGSAAIDLRACLNTEASLKQIEESGDGVYVYRDTNTQRVTKVSLAPGAQLMIDSGLRIHIGNPDFAGFALPRSGSGRKGLVLGNGTGLIDSDYQGNLMQVLWNRGNKPYVINDGDRVSQYVIVRIHQFTIKEVPFFTLHSERGAGGFGHSGVK